MKLADKATIESLVADAARELVGDGFSARANAADDIALICGPVCELYGGVEAVPPMVLIQLALQVAAIIFGDGAFSIEKLQAVLKLLQGVFV